LFVPYSFPQATVPFALGLWAMGAVAGPVFGPVVGGFAAAAENWRWPIWELAWISGFTSLFLSIFLPETLADTILLKRARRLRKLTGNDNLRSLSEIKQSEMAAGAVAREYLVRPFQLMMEPAVLFINLYVGREYISISCPVTVIEY
jgi:DHA1 family multidrug resistance protein-like MFS transporter